jgi:hypothetical protein
MIFTRSAARTDSVLARDRTFPLLLLGCGQLDLGGAGILFAPGAATGFPLLQTKVTYF